MIFAPEQGAACNMKTAQREETRELMMGTWIGIALIVEMLISHNLIDREDLLLLLSQFEAAAPGIRGTALAGIRAFIERGFTLTVGD
jgi:hypothetical protein